MALNPIKYKQIKFIYKTCIMSNVFKAASCSANFMSEVMLNSSSFILEIYRWVFALPYLCYTAIHRSADVIHLEAGVFVYDVRILNMWYISGEF